MAKDLTAEQQAAKEAQEARVLISTVVDEKYAIDLSMMSNQAIYDTLKPLMAKGLVVGVVESCKAGATQRNGDVSNWRVKYAIVTASDRFTTRGKAIMTAKGYWVDSDEKVEINTVETIKSNSFVIVHNHSTYESIDGESGEVATKNVTIKAFQSKESLIKEDGRSLADGYTALTDINSKAVITTLQESKFHTLVRTQSVNLDV